jgi:hypothetical protein
MSKFRSLIFLFLISLAGLLWVTFLMMYAGWFLEGMLILLLIGGTNVMIIPLRLYR